MDSIFGRRKTKPRQSSISSTQELSESSIPYDKLGPPPSSPLPVGTVSQGLRGGSYISAPITNPTLTTNGTEFNKFGMTRSRAGGDRGNEDHGLGSPSTFSVSDSSTLYNDSVGTSSGNKLYTPQTARMRRSEASSSSGHMLDFGQFPANGYAPMPASASTGTMRPMSSATTRSEGTRHSKYSSLSSEGTSQNHFYHPHRHNNSDDAQLSRPDTDEEIEALFDNVKRTRDLADMPNLSIDQKWHMVYNDWQIRRKEEKQRDDQTRRQTELGQPAAIIRETPEWYIQKFLNKTITPKQAGSLQVSLRSLELRSVQFCQSTINGVLTLKQLVSTLHFYTRNISPGTDTYAY